ncbi:hypothetical protein BC834DRAFT_865983 [Gloeopeniophorella convolvens]|nr:hypothetical protein BC834DRAFT_865983 [Gloeopeniophorella convolvens]
MGESTSPEPRQRTRKPTNMRSISDNIHGYVTMGPHVWDVVDTRHFQRLRHIKQLGTSYHVWPGASHNRFEHSLGTAYLARQMAVHLKDAQPELGITDRDVKCVELAGLCHDLGHGPWSHVWDGVYIPRALKAGFLPKDKDWQHEVASEMMFDDMMMKYNLNVPPEDVTFIKALIAGDHSRCRHEKPFLFEIVANKRNGIDVDKFDYIARDTRGIGDNQNLSLTRLIGSARVVENQICFDIKDANQIYELCYTRFSLHKRIYNHKTAKAIENMLVDAMLAAEPYLKIAGQIDNPDRYLVLTDEIWLEIQRSEAPELAESQRILERLENRDLYRCVDYKVFDYEHRQLLQESITEEGIVAEAKRACSARIGQSASQSDPEVDDGDDVITLEDIQDLTPDKVIVTFSTMHYGMRDKSPLDFIKFYPKNRPDQCFHARRGDLSLLMPASFAEVLLRVYTKDVRFFGIVQAGYRSLLARTTREPEPTSTDVVGSESDGVAERARTPRTFERVSSFNKSFSAGGADSSDGASPFLNQFTTVGKSYGKGLAHPTSPTRSITTAPRAASTSVADTAKKQAAGESIGLGAPPPMPASPTRAKRGPKNAVAVSDGGVGLGGGRGPNEAAPTDDALSPGAGLRTSKRLKVQGGGTPKRKKL